MKLRKLKRPLLIFFLSFTGILILLLATLNLPFSQRFATRKVNQILTSIEVPIQLDAIHRILPGSVLIHGISFTDLEGDTMIYAGELNADIRLLALIRKKVLLQQVDLEHVVVKILMNENSSKYHIAEAFTSDRTPDKIKKKDGKGNTMPWNFGLMNLSMNDINFTFDPGHDDLWLHVMLGEGEIKVREMDVSKKILDIRKISLAQSRVSLLTPSESDNPKPSASRDIGLSPWTITGKDIDLEEVGIRIADRVDPGSDSTGRQFNLAKLDMKLKDLRLDEDHIGVKVKRMSFDLGNGFSMKNLEGELESEGESTTLKLDIESGHSQASLQGQAHHSFLSMISEPGNLHVAHLALSKTNISLLDVIPFFRANPGNPGFISLSGAPYSMSGDFDWNGTSLDISGFSISQNQNFQMAIEGKVDMPFPVSSAGGLLNLRISEVDESWLKEILQGFGMGDATPEIAGLTLESQLSRSFTSPDFDLRLKSQMGNVSASGSLNFATDSFFLRSSFDKILLGEILSAPELGAVAGSASLRGHGFSHESFHSALSLQLESLEYKDYSYSQISLKGRGQAGVYDFHLRADDAFFQGDIKARMIPNDSLFRMDVSGNLTAQLDQLHLLNDTLGISTQLEGRILRGPKVFESEISALGTVLTDAYETVDIQNINAILRTDSLNTTLSSTGDFFSLDMKVAKSISEFDSLGQAYANYLSTFKESDPKSVAARVKELPEINARAQITDHDVLDIMLKDTGFHIGNLDLSMLHQSVENKINYGITGHKLQYEMVEINSFNAAMVDSAGLLKMNMAFDDASLFKGPKNDWLLNANLAETEGTTSLSVQDPLGRLMYNIAIAAMVDSTHLKLKVPEEQFIINGTLWQLETADLLSMDLSTLKVDPTLRMYTDSSFLHFLSFEEGEVPGPGYTICMNQVEMESLVREDLFPGRPDASISGSVGFSVLNDTERKIESDLQFLDVEYSDLNFDLVSLNGHIIFGDSGTYSVDVLARLDSAMLSFKSKRGEGGEREIVSEISQIPLNTIQPFTTNSISDLRGYVTGNFDAINSGGEEHVNGQLSFNGVELQINALNSTFKIPDQDLVLEEEKLIFDNFRVLDTSSNELLVDGFLDFQVLDQVATQLDISSSRLQLMSRGEVDEKTTFYGDVFIDSKFSVNGPLVNPTIRGNILLSKGTELFYRHMDDLTLSESEQIVNFVGYTDEEDQDVPSALSRHGKFITSSVETRVEIDPTTRFNVGLSKKIYELDLQITGGGSLLYNMLNNNQMSLTGSYEISEGAAELKLVGWPDKSFRISKGGYINWHGRVDEPELNFQALNRVSSSYLNPVDGKQRPVDFDVILQLSGYLSELDVLFTVNTSDQYLMSTINALGPEEQMRQAISILLFESIDLPGISSSSAYMSQQVNQILASQLNQLTQNTFKGVDISFGIDTYKSTTSGGDQSNTSLSYEVRKSLMNDRAQIEVSGRMRDMNQHAGASDLSLSNIAFEYSLDSAGTKFLKVYNEHTYEDVFEGEVIKTGIGVTLRKRFRKFSDIWKREKKKKKEKGN